MTPTYNERENLQRLVPEIEAVLSRNHLMGYIVIVDDNSPNGTGELAEQLAKEYSNIIVLHRQAKLGIGSAYREAFQMGLAGLNVNAVLEMDADLSHDPSCIPGLIEKLVKGYDVVVGSRYVEGGGINDWSVVRQLISRGANFLARKLTGVKVNDMTSGFRAYRIGALRSIELGGVTSNGYAFQLETLYRCAKAGLRIAEHPILFSGRVNGKSKLDKVAIIEFVNVLMRIAFNRIARALPKFDVNRIGCLENECKNLHRARDAGGARDP